MGRTPSSASDPRPDFSTELKTEATGADAADEGVRPTVLVGHRVNNVVHSDADPERGVLLGISGIVSMLPGIA